MYADYSNGLVNLSNSVLKNFGAEYHHETLSCMDRYLEKNYKNVVVLLLDGMGSENLKYHLDLEGFFRKHYICDISSVFPPTTTAATTTIESGLTPAEHGWLGWSLYFSEIGKIVNAFTNRDQYTGKMAERYHVASRYLPYTPVYDKINEAGIGHGYSVSHFGTNKIENPDEMCREIERLCNADGRKYIYAYWNEPDSSMHDMGCENPVVTKCLRRLEKKIEKMAEKLRDTLLVITADHGHIDLRHYILGDYPDLMDMLIRPISMETRAAAFYVKEEYKKMFPEKFKEYFGDDFLLFSTEEMIERQIFGDGVPHEKIRELAGDFLAAAVSDRGISYSSRLPMLLSNHAGMTEKEMQIPFIVIEK